jgi:hypothetical protein
MKTRGIEVPCDKDGEPMGYLLFGFKRADGTHTPSPNWIPDAFWARLKHAVAAEHLVGEFKDDEAATRAAPHHVGGLVAEQALFQRWVIRLGFDVSAGHYSGQGLWPWTRGWTEDSVDAYLQTRRPHG